LEVPDHDLLDFAAGDSFTVLGVIRRHATLANFQGMVSKNSGGNVGYRVRLNADGRAWFKVGDNSQFRETSSPAMSAGVLTTFAGVSSPGSTVTYGNAVSGTASSPALATSENSSPLWIGRESAYADFEGYAFAVWRRALSADEIAAVNSYYQGRIGA
jgi:hypothetical protein